MTEIETKRKQCEEEGHDWGPKCFHWGSATRTNTRIAFWGDLYSVDYTRECKRCGVKIGGHTRATLDGIEG